MRTLMKRLLRIANIKPEKATKLHNLPDIDTHIETTCVRTLARLLADPEHPLARKLLKRTRATRSKLAFKAAKCNTEAYRSSFVQTTLRIVRDGKRDLYTGKGTTDKNPQQPLPQSTSSSPTPNTQPTHKPIMPPNLQVQSRPECSHPRAPQHQATNTDTNTTQTHFHMPDVPQVMQQQGRSQLPHPPPTHQIKQQKRQRQQPPIVIAPPILPQQCI